MSILNPEKRKVYLMDGKLVCDQNNRPYYEEIPVCGKDYSSLSIYFPVMFGDHINPDPEPTGECVVAVDGNAFFTHRWHFRHDNVGYPYKARWGCGCDKSVINVSEGKNTAGHHYNLLIEFKLYGFFENHRYMTVSFNYKSNYKHGHMDGSTFVWEGATSVGLNGKLSVKTDTRLKYEVSAAGKTETKTISGSGSFSLSGDPLMGKNETNYYPVDVRITKP